MQTHPHKQDHNAMGTTTTVPLVPGGESMPVSRANRVRFIYLMADYKLNKQLRAQSRAFVRGMYEMVSLDSLRMFSSDELRLLISGAPTINLADLKANTNYANGYGPTHELIKWLWEILEDLDAPDVANFLRFSTSCSRAPLLGFGKLYPKFCIQLRPSGPDEETLPTSSTCMNLLRLPRYFSKERLRAKLLYAVNSGTGFELT